VHGKVADSPARQPPQQTCSYPAINHFADKSDQFAYHFIQILKKVRPLNNEKRE
jgi:hypothetical protein